jgi:hypothetical protein
MPLTAEQRDQVASELKRFTADLDLSDEQKQKLHTFPKLPGRFRNTGSRTPTYQGRI